MNIKNFEKIIRECLEINNNDDKWEWRVSLIDENKATIRWGYFDYLNEPDNVVIRIDEIENENDTEYMIVACLPYNSEYNVLVGKHFWDDCDKIEDGLIIAIDGIISLAKKLY